MARAGQRLDRCQHRADPAAATVERELVARCPAGAVVRRGGEGTPADGDIEDGADAQLSGDCVEGLNSKDKAAIALCSLGLTALIGGALGLLTWVLVP